MAEEQHALDEQVAAQNLSQDEVMKMNAEDASLDRTLSDLKVKSRDAAKAVSSLEILVAARMDAVEQAIGEYMALVYKLGLHPHPPAELSHISFALELNGSAPEPRHLVVGPDIRTVIKPALAHFAELKRRERGLTDDERVKLDDELDKVTMACEDLEQEVNAIETKIRVVNNEAEDLRDVGHMKTCSKSY
jgi:kinetochore protein NDC80